MNNLLPTYSLRSIEIENFKGIKHTKIEDLPKEAKWIFLTGKNGYGKSCVLQGIFIGFYGIKRIRNFFIEDNYGFSILLEHYNTINTAWEKREVNEQDESYNNPPFSYLSGYGSSRLNLQSPQSQNEEKEKSAPGYGLFNPDGILLNIEIELKNWYYRSQVKDLEAESKALFANQFKIAKEVLLYLMPNIEDISVDAKEDKIYYSEKDEEENILTERRSFEELASGNKSIIAMVGDMMVRLFKYQRRLSSAADLEGIVIIDELDLHLHPSWQKALPGLLSEIFPKIQFIASTHSPIPFLGAPEGSVFLKVNRTEEEGITLERLDIDISDLTPNLILSSPIFGFTDIFPATHQASERIRTEDTMTEARINDYVQKELERHFNEEKSDALKKLFKK